MVARTCLASESSRRSSLSWLAYHQRRRGLNGRRHHLVCSTTAWIPQTTRRASRPRTRRASTASKARARGRAAKTRRSRRSSLKSTVLANLMTSAPLSARRRFTSTSRGPTTKKSRGPWRCARAATAPSAPDDRNRARPTAGRTAGSPASLSLGPATSTYRRSSRSTSRRCAYVSAARAAEPLFCRCSRSTTTNDASARARSADNRGSPFFERGRPFFSKGGAAESPS
mmetsp:Transcript_301/g.1117  ORF Transcript_301/g.1117 Transcript_301/m.1117 type:complete len:228 (-) Transcript_301:114-797(-)